MKVSFSIEKGQEIEGGGLLSKGTVVHKYVMRATFVPTELEKKVFNDHPLFQSMVFMRYSEVDKWSTGLIFQDKHQADVQKVIQIKDIYSTATYQFRAYSVNRILELRQLVKEAVVNFMQAVDILEKLEGTEVYEPQREN